MNVAVVKIGVGNIASVMFALERLGVRAVATDDAKIIEESERIILPGVGAAAFAMQMMCEKKLDLVIRRFERPLLCICLGQQLLFEESEEGGAIGLGLLKGAVTRLPESVAAPIPHMGWTQLSRCEAHPLTDGVADGDYAYFVHSYVCPVTEATLSSAEYGQPFAAIVGDGNRFGCQFHPERSGATGKRILENFLALPC